MVVNNSQDEEYVVNFRLLLKDGADEEAVASAFRERLATLVDVEQVRVSAANTRAIDPVTIAAGIGVTVLLIKQTTEAVEALGKLVRAMKMLVAEIEGVSDARMEIGDQVRNLSEVGSLDLEKAAKAALE